MRHAADVGASDNASWPPRCVPRCATLSREWHIVGKMRGARIADGRRAFEPSTRFTTQLRRTRFLAGSWFCLVFLDFCGIGHRASPAGLRTSHDYVSYRQAHLVEFVWRCVFSRIQFAGFDNALTFQRPGVHCRHYLHEHSIIPWR